ncbi:MAG: UDP-N-acetylglucosamine 2-epimerase, partial [Muribaculaceae bacterium]|nr:UDP-N-acetylglucosamine 2-epimerase [Muribaculaceae bacterium]
EGVIGNSSSGIVEVASLGVPTLDVGIRQSGRERAMSVIHCDATSGAVATALSLISSPMIKKMASKRENPYFKPQTPATMIRAIKRFLNE